MHHPTFAAPDLTTFCRLDELGLEAVGQLLEPDRAVLECRVINDDPWCRKCGAEGVARDTVTRPLAHEPFGHRPTTLLIRVRRYRCAHCRRTWRQDTTKAAAPRAKISRGGIGWALTTIGVDEHVWRHTRFGDKYVTVIIDLTSVREKSGPARLLDMVEGRSKQVFKQWLAARRADWSKAIEVVAMDGFSGFKTAAAEELPDAVPVMDLFHVVRLAGDALDGTRQRVQQDNLGHRGHAGDPLYGVRRTLHTGASLLTEKQTARLDAVFAAEEHIEVEATWGIYQRIVAAYREPDKNKAKEMMRAVIVAVSSGVPAALTEIRRLGRTLKQRAADVLAFFDRPGTSNGPTEAINGRLEHLRGSALGFRNLTHYIARSLLEAGGFRPLLHPRLR
ncbi:ISL3 family transposase [Microbacterium aurantiacum]|uniref:Transposase n=1 Tax=Microbacterium aurantiacum TaxID=162393 RepID=A0A0M8MHX8_9MICO|nr:ISL3 family transposase [Microbacterium chocolatum]KOS10437.1 transposase [Microbacterium chocolatum]